MSSQKYAHGERFRSALSGFGHAVLGDNRVRYKVVISVVFLMTTFLFDDWFHFLFLLSMTGVMVVAEMFNSSIAALCDYVQPGHDTLVGAVKDIAVGAAWIAVFIWAVNILVVMYELINLIRAGSLGYRVLS